MAASFKSSTERYRVWCFVLADLKPKWVFKSFRDCLANSWGSRNRTMVFLTSGSHNSARKCANDAWDPTRVLLSFFGFAGLAIKKLSSIYGVLVWAHCNQQRASLLMSMSFWLRSTKARFSYLNRYESIMQYLSVCNTRSEHIIDKLQTCLFNLCNRRGFISFPLK